MGDKFIPTTIAGNLHAGKGLLGIKNMRGEEATRIETRKSKWETQKSPNPAKGLTVG